MLGINQGFLIVCDIATGNQLCLQTLGVGGFVGCSFTLPSTGVTVSIVQGTTTPPSCGEPV